MNRLLLSLAAITLSTPALAQEQPADTAGISAVIDSFRLAIIARDKAALLRLPANDAITFLGVIDDATLTRARARRPQVKRIVPSSYADFVTDITTASVRSEEKFSNVVIHSDGSVATVYFDYTFEEDAKVTNWGHESWGLIRSDDGWKISSIIYSITLPPTPDTSPTPTAPDTK